MSGGFCDAPLAATNSTVTTIRACFTAQNLTPKTTLAGENRGSEHFALSVRLKAESLVRSGFFANYFRDEATLRMNEYGLRASSGSSGQPLPDEFASQASLFTSVSRIVSVTSQRDLSKVLAPTTFK